ncbi:ABC transporter ATP-binding protein [Roseovarius sp. SYSU LYC5161]|uniref:ABC transporter ATP-binding protein n=1 Tax=Roseovarius halophilus (ex Wu et al. 2025) TaxID=3376060 RepID=UPI002872355B|nr:ABC transporter ATP-binding protein [Roseovarius sp.]
MTHLVEIENVTKAFGDTVAVKEAAFSLAQGEFLTIVGPSGCGKTTLLRMIAGFETPTSGHIRIAGQPVDRVPAYKRSIGMVFQRLALFPHMSAAENVAYPLKMRRFDPAEIPGRVEEYLDLVKLGGYGGRMPHELSGGQQQRIAIARALSFSPDLLLLDEPLSALDKKLREEMQLEFRRIQQELGVTTINVTHDQREALVMSDKIVVMSDGVVQQADRPEALYRNPGTRFVASFIGATSMFAGRVVEADADGVRVAAGDTVIAARASGEVLGPGDDVDCAIRAEQVRIGTGEDLENRLSGIVEQRIFEGDRVVYAIRVPALGDAMINVFDHDPAAHREYGESEEVPLGWNRGDLFAFPRAS